MTRLGRWLADYVNMWRGRAPMYNRGGYGAEGFLTPGVTWLLLTADVRRYDDERYCGDYRFEIGGRALPGALAMPDQPHQLVWLGWLYFHDNGVAWRTHAGQLALDLIEAGDFDGYDHYLRASHREADRRTRSHHLET